MKYTAIYVYNLPPCSQAVSVGVLVASAVCLGLVAALPAFSNAERAQIMAMTNLNRQTLLFNSYAGGGIGVGVAVLIVVWEILMIVLRFLNIGLLNIKSKIFLVIVRKCRAMLYYQKVIPSFF